MDAIITGDAKAGWYIESSFAQSSEPILITNRYRVIGAEPARGNMGPAPEFCAGLQVTYVRDSSYPHPKAKGGKACRWSAYKHGAYLHVHADSEATEQITTPIECPKVRKGIETRYHLGRWEKYSKREGWVRA
jgi:hypothetical protein